MDIGIYHMNQNKGQSPETAVDSENKTKGSTEKMKIVKKLLGMSVCLLVLGVFAQSALADVVSEIVKRGEMRVAVQTQGPPISYIDTKGNRTGFAVELVQMMADDIGVKLKLLDYDWKGLIPAVVSGKADFLAADMTPKATRALVLNFTDPYMYSRNVIYSKKSKPFVTWQDACVKGMSIAVTQGSSNIGVLKAKCPQATIKQFTGGGPAVAQAVAADRVDAGINDEASAKGYMVQYPEFHILEGAPDRGPLSFATRPDETHLLEWMNNYIMLIKADGRLDKLKNYWMFDTGWKEEKTPVPKG
jgi:polar amino acid transport system substrate-binding protein